VTEKAADKRKKEAPLQARRRRGRERGKPHLVIIEHRLRFKTDAPVSVEAVIASLNGMERIVKSQLPKVIESVTGARIKSAELLVSGLEDGSFLEDLSVKLLFKSKDDYNKFTEKISDAVKAGWDGGTPMLKLVIGILIGAIVLGGLGHIWGGQANNQALSSIQGDNNAVVIIGAEAYQISPQDFQKAIDSALGKVSRKRAAQAALDATAPAREQGVAAEIEIEGKAVPLISKRTAELLPSSITPPDASEDQSYKRAEVYLRASDYDSAVKGWAGTIPGLIDQRTRIIFANTADSAKAAFQPVIMADVTVTYSDSLHQRALLIIIDKIY
jgi:hypothetical protein